MVTAWAAENRLVLGTAAVAGRLERDRRDPRVAPHAGPGRGDRDDRRRRLPGRERPDHPRAGGALPAGRQGQPADAAGGRRGGLRPGVRGRLRRGPVRRARGGRGRPRAARGAVRDGRLRPRRACRPEWPDVAAVVQVNREREVGGERTVTSHYYLTSHAGTAAEFGRLGAGPLGHRERAALGPRRGVPGGSQPHPGGERRGQPGDDPAGGGVAAEAGTGQGQRGDEAPQGRLG